MWPHPGGHLSPPTHSTLDLVLSVRAPTQILGPLIFGQTGMTPETNAVRRRPSLVSPLLEFQPLLQMPLGPQISQRTRAYPRPQYDGRRRRPFRLLNDNNIEPYNRHVPLLPQTRNEIRTLPGSADILTTDSSEVIHRTNHWTRDCTRMNENQCSCQWTETSILRCNFHIQNHGESSTREEPQATSVNNSSSLAMTSVSDEAMDLNVEELTFDRNFNVPVLVSRASFPNSNEPRSESLYVTSDCPIPNVSSTNRCLLHTVIVGVPENSYSLKTSDANTKEKSIFSINDHNDHHHQHNTHAYTPSVSEVLTTENDNNLATATLPSRTPPVPMMPQPTALARQVANRVIKHARDIRYPNESEMWCLDCGLFPMLPVTGQCGHTRCIKCVEANGACPCGVQAPDNLHVNILIQDLIEKILPGDLPIRTVVAASRSVNRDELQAIYALPSTSTASQREWRGPERHRRSARSLYYSPMGERSNSTVSRRQPISLQARFKYAHELLSVGRFREAAAHLAHVAASSEPTARTARTLLAQTVAALSQTRDPRRITRELYRLVRLHSGISWLKESDLECILCYHTFTKPVTTPCGHTYCRLCIEKSLDYRKTCALCLRSLNHFNLAATRDTTFVCAALASINAVNVPSPPDPDVIPIFACTAAYPTIPCPLFIFDPRYWFMIRRVLESGSRKFGMVAYERDRTYSDYGTILEVRDCVQFEDGRSILSTVGVSRFKVIERDIREGCDVARIQPLTDITPTDELVIWDLRLIAQQISEKAVLWLSSLNKNVVSDIETAFGQMPRFDNDEEEWWERPDGPNWLWWLIAILPLRSEIQVLILSTKHLLKRMMAVSRTLEAACDLDHVLNNPVVWLPRIP